jgi:hypothetical protein
MFMSAYKKPAWPAGAGAFAAFYFDGEEDHPLLHVGTFRTSLSELLVEYDHSELAEALADRDLWSSPASPDRVGFSGSRC